MRRFDCPHCGKFLARADGQRVETKCPRCVCIVEAVPLRAQEALFCTSCGKHQYVEFPPMRPTYCVACGSHTLKPVPTQRPHEAPTSEDHGRALVEVRHSALR